MKTFLVVLGGLILVGSVVPIFWMGGWHTPLAGMLMLMAAAGLSMIAVPFLGMALSQAAPLGKPKNTNSDKH